MNKLSPWLFGDLSHTQKIVTRVYSQEVVNVQPQNVLQLCLVLMCKEGIKKSNLRIRVINNDDDVIL